MFRYMKRALAIFLVLLMLNPTVCFASECGAEEPAQMSADAFASDAERIKYEYEYYNDFTREDGVTIWEETIPGENPFVYIDMARAIQLAESGTGVLFIGSGWCRVCRMDILLLLEALEDERTAENPYIQELYYLNPDLIDREDPLYGEFCAKVLTPMRDYIRDYEEPYTNLYGTEKLIRGKMELADGDFENVSKYKYEVSFWDEGKLLGMNVGTTPHFRNSDTPPGAEDYEEFHERFWEFACLFGTDLCDYC